MYFLVTAKPKQNARNASKQGGQQQQNSHQNNNQKTNATSVPQSQPPKSSNKSHKKFDINQKGANKEGTDMDAFNDNNVKETKETVIANNATTNSAAINDIINANSHIPNNVTAGVVNNNNSKGVINSVNNEINNKKFESNETINSNISMTIKSTVPQQTVQQQAPPTQLTTAAVKPKSNKVDVTSIVREQPKVATKPLSSVNNSTDEIDRAAPTTGFDMLNANNNNNKMTSKVNSEQTVTKTNSEIINTVENKLPYQEGKIFLILQFRIQQTFSKIYHTKCNFKWVNNFIQ